MFKVTLRNSRKYLRLDRTPVKSFQVKMDSCRNQNLDSGAHRMGVARKIKGRNTTLKMLSEKKPRMKFVMKPMLASNLYLSLHHFSFIIVRLKFCPKTKAIFFIESTYEKTMALFFRNGGGHDGCITYNNIFIRKQ